MSAILEIVRNQFLGALALLLVISGGVYAATGQPLKLGLLNKADLPTVVQNTDVGAALELRTRAGQPPLKVTSTRLVRRLNAAKLGGKPAGAFAARTSVYTKDQSDARYLEDLGPRLLKVVSTRGLTGVLLDTAVKAPGDGKIVLLASGAQFSAGTAMYLTVGDYKVPNVCAGTVEFCTSASSDDVSAGADIAIKAEFASPFDGVLLVFFQPG